MQEHSGIPRDPNQLAAFIVAQTTGTEITKNPAAVAFGRLGGLKGGRARADSLSEERGAEIARNAATARWKKKQSP